MISVRLNQELEKELEEIAKITNRPKSFFIKEALKEYLEDVKDILDAKERISDPKREMITLDELKRELDV
ncbi:ribbon-helix-helix domain-containing protein [Hydrogenimonas thermophila]|uniref:type II toxin-antitoxin system RelB family antitoxin n=1 Tax=Hydrogenimonas thermophila TaxID=223786 RepID=UPI0029370B9B|nr:ribbon-helix-helix domain-containing protein [Hydrogenimonas thermophila]WOE69011.1 ribbon-helix-helix domain-containing protein [Hydrogenimonas thermophila]WOE71522.1 ribbon-helix-helix domain-containing protein [Hydrogenimonas thermophila]